MKRILIVDDDSDTVERLGVLLADRYQTDSASNGFDALAQLNRQAYDMVLLDIRMPGLDGPGLIKLLQERRIPVPIVLMSANPDLSALARRLGVSLSLTKPFPVERLEAIIDQL
ncbi:MAG TPA: response regulator [Gemmatimonadales bacterium]|jgi:DNA-binding NtrC family response regulator